MFAGKKRKSEEEVQFENKRSRLSSSVIINDVCPTTASSRFDRFISTVSGFLRRAFSRNWRRREPPLPREQSTNTPGSHGVSEGYFTMDKNSETLSGSKTDLFDKESLLQILPTSSQAAGDPVLPAPPVLFQSNLYRKFPPTSVVDTTGIRVPSQSPRPRLIAKKRSMATGSHSVLDGIQREKDDAMFRQMISFSSPEDEVPPPFGRSLMTLPTKSIGPFTTRYSHSPRVQPSSKYTNSSLKSVPTPSSPHSSSLIPGVRLYSTTTTHSSLNPPPLTKTLPTTRHSQRAAISPHLVLRDPITSLKNSEIVPPYCSSVEPVPLPSELITSVRRFDSVTHPHSYSVTRPHSYSITHPHSYSNNPEELSFSPTSPASPRSPTNLQDAFEPNSVWLDEMSRTFTLNMSDYKARIEVLHKYTKIYEQERMEAEDRRNQKFLEKLNNLKIRPWAPSLEEDEIELRLDLNEEAVASIDSAWSGGPAGEVLTERKNIRITRGDLLTLKGLEWLNDEIINFYLGLVVDSVNSSGKRKVHLFNSFFYPKIMSAGYVGVRRWTKKVDIFSFDVILLPVHLGMHWCLASIDFTKKQICYFDSLKGSNNHCLRVLRDYLVSEAKDKKQEVYDVSDWELECRTDIPEQHNGSDCGVFTCMYARHLARDKSMAFTQSDLPAVRRMMVAEIISQQLL